MRTRLTLAVLLGLSLATPALAQGVTAPLVPPEMHYVVDAVVDLKSTQLSGQGSAKLRNVGKHNVSVLTIRWFDWRSGSYEITVEDAEEILKLQFEGNGTVSSKSAKRKQGLKAPNTSLHRNRKEASADYTD